MTWLANNIGVIITAAVVVLGVVSTWVLYGADIRQLKADKVRAEKEKEKQDKVIEELKTALSMHSADTTLHIDPHRDEKRWDDFKNESWRRFDRVEEKIEKLMLVQAPVRV